MIWRKKKANLIFNYAYKAIGIILKYKKMLLLVCFVSEFKWLVFLTEK